jgi:hypothetical protein
VVDDCPVVVVWPVVLVDPPGRVLDVVTELTATVFGTMG